MKKYLLAAFGIVTMSAGMIVAPAPAHAHHSFSMFDQSKIVTIEGTVTKFAWTNPHVFITVDARKDKGQVVSYLFEGGSTNIHKRAGWSSKSMKVGDRIKVSMYPLRSGQPGGRIREVTLPDGQVLTLISGAAN